MLQSFELFKKMLQTSEEIFMEILKEISPNFRQLSPQIPRLASLSLSSDSNSSSRACQRANQI